MTSIKMALQRAERQSSVEPRGTLRLDLWTVLAVGVGSLFWASAARPVSDPDIWWHVRTGQLILDSGVPHVEPWAYTALGRPWVPTSWATDVVLALLRDGFGWSGIVAFKLVLSGLLLLSLGRLLFKATGGPAALVVFTLVTLVVSPFFSERPQLVSLVLTVWLAHQAAAALNGRQWPWWTLPLTYLWANLHGMWVLVPVTLVVTMMGAVLDRGPHWKSRIRRSAMLAIGTIALSALTPAGPRLTYWPFVVRSAAAQISEWQPTTLTDKYGLAYLGVFLLWALAASRAKVPVAWSESLWMFALLMLGLQAGRNVAPTVILMAPVAAAALSRSFTMSSHRPLVGRVHPVVPAGILALAAVLATWVHIGRGAVTDQVPFEIAASLKDGSHPVRVLNAYNVGGFLTGEGAPDISVSIDGRTDNYDPAFIDRYLLGTEHLVGWRDLVADLHPEAAVFKADSTMATELRHAGWVEARRDGVWLLLRPPTGE